MGTPAAWNCSDQAVDRIATGLSVFWYISTIASLAGPGRAQVTAVTRSADGLAATENSTLRYAPGIAVVCAVVSTGLAVLP